MRTGVSDSIEIIAVLQKTSSSTSPRSTGLSRTSRRPEAMTPGVSRAEDSARDQPVESTWVTGSRSRTTTAARWSTESTRQMTTGSHSAECDPIGCQATRPPDSSAPPAIASPRIEVDRERSWSTSAPGRVAWTVSTYQASSGPESRARKTPVSTDAMTKAVKEWATRSATIAATLASPAAMRTGRRPRASAKPEVGSSRTTTAMPMTAEAVSACGRVRPRSSCHRTSSPTTKPIGSQRVVVRVRKTRRAARGERGSVIVTPTRVRHRRGSSR